MSKVLRNCLVVSLTLLFAVNSFGLSAYAKEASRLYVFRDHVYRAKIYERKSAGNFEYTSVAANKGNRVFMAEEAVKAPPRCGEEGMMLKIKGLGWICSTVFRPVAGIGDDYSLWPGSAPPKQPQEQEGATEGAKEAPEGQKAKIQKNTQGQSADQSDSQQKQPKKLLKLKRFQELRKSVLSKTDTQFVTPEDMDVVALGKNYLNRIQCQGSLDKVIFNNKKKIEIEKQGQNLFVKAPDNKQDTFLTDFVVVCGGQTFQMYGGFDASLPGQKVILEIDKHKGQKALTSKDREKIKKKNSLPFESKVSEILKKAYNKKYPRYWGVDEIFIEKPNFSVLRRINTNIGGLLVYDAVCRKENSALEAAKDFVLSKKMRFVALGKVEGSNKFDRVFIVVEAGE